MRILNGDGGSGDSCSDRLASAISQLTEKPFTVVDVADLSVVLAIAEPLPR